MEISVLKNELKSFSITKKFYEKLHRLHKKTIEEIKTIGPGLEKISIAELNDIFSTLIFIKENVKEISKELKKVDFYCKCIKLLSTEDQAILTSAYIEGKPCWKVAQEHYYSEEGMRKRLKKILKTLSNIIDLKSRENMKVEDFIMALAYKNVYKLEDGKLVKNTENYIKYKDQNGKSRIKVNPGYDDFLKAGWYPLKQEENVPKYDPKAQVVQDEYIQEDDHILCRFKVVDKEDVEE